MPKQKVYISSTFRDLKEYRATLIGLFQNQLKSNFELSNVMERMFDDGNYKPFLNECIEAVEDCDLYILILGNKVGSAPSDNTRTYTEIEFDTALEKQKKIFFLKYPVFDNSEIDDKSKHDEVLKKFDGRPSHTFKDNIEFQNAFLLNLYQFLPVQPQNKFNEPAILFSSNGPAEPSVFLGREDELLSIREKLNRSGKLMLINAEGGIGKTTLASKYWYESLYDYKYNAWLFCENGIINSLKELAPKLNVDLSGKDEDQQLSAIKLAVSQVHDDFLIILDNANDSEEIQKFKQIFKGFHWHVLLTSRCAGILNSSEELPINHLPPTLAKELFIKNYKENTEEFDVLIDRVLKAIGYHTLLIDVFSKNLKKASKNCLNSEAFLYKLENEGLYLGDDSFNIQTQYLQNANKTAANTDQILDILYDFSNLEEDERYALVNISLLPAESFTDIFLRDLMVDTDKTIRKKYLKTLENLYQNGWLSGEINEEYRISPVIQRLVLDKNKNTLVSDAQVLLNKLNYLLVSDGSNLLNLSLAEAIPYVKLVGRLTKYLGKIPSWEIGIINFNAGIYFENTGDIISSTQCYEVFKDINKKLIISDSENLTYKIGLASSYSKLGGVYEKKGDFENAFKNYLEDFKILKVTSEDNPENLNFKNGLAISYERLGDIYEQKGDYENALKNYFETNKIGQEIYKHSTENIVYKDVLAVSFEKLGRIYEQKGDNENALKNYLNQLRIFQEIYKINPEDLQYKNGLAVAYSKLGEIYEKRGDYENSFNNYLNQLRIFQEIYKISPENLDYKNGLAISYSKLGGIYQKKEDYENAFKNYLEAFKISIEICSLSPENLKYKNDMAICYLKLGGIYEEKGDYQKALESYLEYNKISQELSDKSPENLYYKNYLGVSYDKLGRIYNKKDDYKNAIKNYLEMHNIFQEINNISPDNLTYKNGLAMAYCKLGYLHVNVDIRKAVNYVQVSVNLYEQLVKQAPDIIEFSKNYRSIKSLLDKLQPE